MRIFVLEGAEKDFSSYFYNTSKSELNDIIEDLLTNFDIDKTECYDETFFENHLYHDIIAIVIDDKVHQIKGVYYKEKVGDI